jgi:UDP-N-acetylmuramoylalanine-D-glutamate ligase
VFNFDDPPCADSPIARARGALPTQGQLDTASSTRRLRGARRAGRERRALSLSALRLPGVHNRENAVAALAAATAAGAPARRAVTAFPSFEGLPHRMQTVARTGGVEWVNDSKATNAGAALRSLRSYESPLVWIAGGRDKGLDLRARGGGAGRRAAVLIGEAAGLRANSRGACRHDAGTSSARSDSGPGSPSRATWCRWRPPARVSTSSAASRIGAKVPRGRRRAPGGG